MAQLIVLLQNEKFADFGHGKKVFFHLGSWKNYPSLTILSWKKRGFFKKVRENCFGELLGTLVRLTLPG